MKNDFPIFAHNPDLIYLDSAATAQKPRVVIDALMQLYEKNYASVHRGIYWLSENMTLAYEAARQTVCEFIHAKHPEEIIFTKGATESLNLVAYAFGSTHIKPDDEIILTMMEHHSNIVPWQQLCARVGAKITVIPLLENGELDFARCKEIINAKTKLIALSHVSNVLGVINPVQAMISLARENHIPVLIDGAQAVAHFPVDVQALDCDFYVFSSHKLYGPTGVGVLYAKTRWLEKMIPYQTGGNAILRVTFEKTEFKSWPHCFEAGTPNIAGVIGLAAAIHYVQGIGFSTITTHEKKLLAYATHTLLQIDGIKIYGTTPNKAGVISFALKNVHAHDIATILDQDHICVRAGHHCAMPLMDYLKVSALTRVSLGIYNTTADIDALVHGLENVRKIFHE